MLRLQCLRTLLDLLDGKARREPQFVSNAAPLIDGTMNARDRTLVYPAIIRVPVTLDVFAPRHRLAHYISVVPNDPIGDLRRRASRILRLVVGQRYRLDCTACLMPFDL